MIQRVVAAFFSIAIFLIAGCAVFIPGTEPKTSQNASEASSQTSPQVSPRPQQYAGRISLVFEREPGQSETPQAANAPQPFSGSFELRGNARTGELDLLTPLGSIVAQLVWSPGRATLKSGSETRNFPSAASLIEQATGAALPPELLFAWLRGSTTNADSRTYGGWRVDLSRHGEGRIIAKRTSPAPAATLRIVLERP
jgi:outer membrane lipoprotein LolB